MHAHTLSHQFVLLFLNMKLTNRLQMDTINRLLKKQAPKRRGRITEIVAEGDEEPEMERAPSGWTKYSQTVEGTILAVPDEWLEAPVGKVFEGPASRNPAPWSGIMVQEVS